NIVLAGVAADGTLGFMQVMPIVELSNISSILYRTIDPCSPITKVHFDDSGSMVVRAHEEKITVCHIDDREPSIFFEFAAKVMEVIFGPTKDYLFVGLEDGSVYLSQSKN